jgi:hypothetical protein
MVKCKLCQQDFNDDKSFHSHLKSHKLRMLEYYQVHEPRYDLRTGERINFKSKDYYFSNDFNNKINLKKWLKSQPLEKRKEYLSNFLKKRKEKHSLEFAPSEVELRSITSPAIPFYQEVFGGYYSYCSSIGLKQKYQYPSSLLKYKEKQGFKIFIDTREQKPLVIDYPTESKGLKFGDYALSDPDCKCYIERKSITDFIGTLSGGFGRFCREIERALAADASLVVLVERPLQECLSFQHLNYVSKKIKVTPEFVFHNVREIIQKYPSVQFLFVDGREECVRVMKRIFFSDGEFKNYDLQLMYDLKLL